MPASDSQRQPYDKHTLTHIRTYKNTHLHIHSLSFFLCCAQSLYPNLLSLPLSLFPFLSLSLSLCLSLLSPSLYPNLPSFQLSFSLPQSLHTHIRTHTNTHTHTHTHTLKRTHTVCDFDV